MRKHIKTIAISLLLASFLTSCLSKEDPMESKLINVINTAHEGNDVDARYYKVAGDRELQLHIFYPDNYEKNRDEPYPVALNFHGGGWTQGPIEWGYGEAEYLSSLGFVGIAVEYRLADYQTSVLKTMKDANSAIRWVRKYAGDLNIHRDKVLSIGHSAGGHLSLSTAMFPHFKEESEDEEISSVPDMVWAYAPPVELTKDNYFKNLLRGEELAKNCSPLSNVRPLAIPLYIITGTVDPVIPVSTIRSFVEEMKEAGNSIELWEYETGDHMFFYDGGSGTHFSQSTLRDALLKSDWIVNQ